MDQDNCDIINDGITTLMLATENNYYDIAKLLIDTGADVDATDNNDNTALSIACLNGFTDLMELLVCKTNNLNSKSKYFDNFPKCTPLMYFIREYPFHSHLLKMLLEKDMDVNIEDDHGDTALILASIAGFQEIVQILIDRGAYVSHKNKEGKTALDYARKSRFTYIIKLLELCQAKELLRQTMLKEKYSNVNVVNFNSIRSVNKCF